MAVAVSTDSAKRALFERLIDDASLFPPARLAMPLAVADHRRHGESAYAWIGGRFVVPASRVEECASTAEGGEPIEVSVILDGAANGANGDALHADLERIARARASGTIRVAGLERRPAEFDGAELAAMVARISHDFAGESMTFWCEVPYAAGRPFAPDAALAALAPLRAQVPPSVQVAAKLRTGGPNPGDIPSAADVAAFLVAAHAHDIPWKATAGLHHPVRGPHDGITTHGFLNLFIAGIALHAGALDPARVETVVAEEDPLAFVVDPLHAAWRDVRVETDAIAAARKRCVAFGSCSFDEPVNDLRESGIVT